MWKFGPWSLTLYSSLSSLSEFANPLNMLKSFCSFVMSLSSSVSRAYRLLSPLGQYEKALRSISNQIKERLKLDITPLSTLVIGLPFKCKYLRFCNVWSAFGTLLRLLFEIYSLVILADMSLNALASITDIELELRFTSTTELLPR